MAYFKCKGEVRARSLVIAEWDFSSSTPLVDKVNGYQLTSNNYKIHKRNWKQGNS